MADKAKPFGRPSKKLTYEKERKEIVNKLYRILNINDGNKTIYFHDIDDDKDKQELVMALKDDCRKYCNSGYWAVYSKENVRRPYLSLIRCILKEMGIDYTTIYKHVKKNGKWVTCRGIMIV